MARPPIAKAKATPHAMRFNMPGIRCLVHRRIIEWASAQVPPTPPIGGGGSGDTLTHLVVRTVYVVELLAVATNVQTNGWNMNVHIAILGIHSTRNF